MPWRKLFSFFIDLTLVMGALLLAIALRDNLELWAYRLENSTNYIVATFLVTIVAIPAFRLNRMIWRLSSYTDYLRVVWAVIAIVLGALAITFAVDRLDGLSRSIPLLQVVLTTSFLVGVRVALRTWATARRARRLLSEIKLRGVTREQHTRTILIVGVSRLSELYAEALSELTRDTVRIAGLVGRSDRQVGRLVGTHKVLGLPEDIEEIVRQLEVHGVFIDRIVVTTPATELSEDTVAALEHLTRSSAIQLQYLSDALDLDEFADASQLRVEGAQFAEPQSAITMSQDALAKLANRPYWTIKRISDFFFALVLVILLAPVMAIVSLLVLLDVGSPVVFWQVRPGRFGQPFKLFKLRTMRAAHAADGSRLSDDRRVSALGNFLRKTRLDELPQLFNILVGEMSFVGPRPLLPVDQPKGFSARLLARPGLTGWAQVIGGRAISANDKAMLDVWYVQNASLGLDLRILLSTIPMVLVGERMDEQAIAKARADLRSKSILTAFDAPRDA